MEKEAEAEIELTDKDPEAKDDKKGKGPLVWTYDFENILKKF